MTHTTSACANEYTVRRGDSFYLIAQRTGVTLKDLLDANPDVNPARLMVGDVLCIPLEGDDAPQEECESTPPSLVQPRAEETAPAETENACTGTIYTVTEGQSIADIQLVSQLNLHTLKTANPNVDLNNLQAGQQLCIPPVNLPCPLPETYQLQTGETLESVAVKFNLPVASLLRANPCLAPQDFESNVCVKLPR